MNSRIAYIIEDDPNLATIFSEAIKKAGFQTEILNDGALAIQRLQEARPSLVVLDMHLPNSSGVEIIQIIRHTPHLRDLIVIIATADPLLAENCQDEADLVLIKPVGFSQLRDLAMRLSKGLE